MHIVLVKAEYLISFMQSILIISENYNTIIKVKELLIIRRKEKYEFTKEY
jgi:hypothetical protein